MPSIASSLTLRRIRVAVSCTLVRKYMILKCQHLRAKGLEAVSPQALYLAIHRVECPPNCGLNPRPPDALP